MVSSSQNQIDRGLSFKHNKTEPPGLVRLPVKHHFGRSDFAELSRSSVEVCGSVCEEGGGGKGRGERIVVDTLNSMARHRQGTPAQNMRGTPRLLSRNAGLQRRFCAKGPGCSAVALKEREKQRKKKERKHVVIGSCDPPMCTPREEGWREGGEGEG